MSYFLGIYNQTSNLLCGNISCYNLSKEHTAFCRPAYEPYKKDYLFILFENNMLVSPSIIFLFGVLCWIIPIFLGIIEILRPKGQVHLTLRDDKLGLLFAAILFTS